MCQVIQDDTESVNVVSVEKPKRRVSIDEALDETGYGKFNYLLILLSGAILFNVVLESVGISFILPVSKCDLDLSNQKKGVLGAISFAGMITSSHLWGFLADTTGRRSVIRPTLISGFFVTVLSSLSPNFATLVVLRFVNGFLLSGGSATIYAFLGEFHGNSTRNRAILSACFLCAVCAIMFPVMAWLVINQDWSFYIPYLDIVYKPWRLYIVVCGMPGFFCGLCLFKIPESPKFMLSIGKEEETIEILKGIYAMNTGNDPAMYNVKSLLPDVSKAAKMTSSRGECKRTNPFVTMLKSMWQQTAPLFHAEHRRKTVLTCIIQFTIFATAHGVYMWFPNILNSTMQFLNEHPERRIKICDIIGDVHRNSITMTNETELLTTCVEKFEISTYQHTISLEVIYTGLFICMGFFISRIGRIPMLFIILVGCGGCGIACILIDIPMVAIYVFVIYLLCGLGTTVISATTVDIFPTHLRAMAVCISLMMGRVGSVVGANLFGALIDESCESAFLLPACALTLSGFLGFLIPKPKVIAASDKDKPHVDDDGGAGDDSSMNLEEIVARAKPMKV